MRAALMVLAAVVAEAQPQPAPKAEFEVVSIKPADPGDPSSGGRVVGGLVERHNVTLKWLIEGAFGLNSYQLEGGPKWMNSARFSIEAKLPAGAPRSKIPAMIQAMLADRFGLEFHRAKKVLSGYELVAARGGPKLQLAGEDENTRCRSGERFIKCGARPMSDLAAMLIGYVGAPVVDKTGLEGKYNFELEFAPLISTPGQDDALPSIFTALQERLGLKLEKTKGPVEILVIDRAEMPSPN